MLFNRQMQIEFSLLGPPTTGQNGFMVGPGQLCPQCGHFWLSSINLEKLSHSKEITATETFQFRMFLSNEGGELLHDAFSPSRGFHFSTNVGPHLPIEIDERGIDGLKRALPRLLDKSDHLNKRCFECRTALRLLLHGESSN